MSQETTNQTKEPETLVPVHTQLLLNKTARFYVIARQWLSALTKGIHRSNLSCGRTLERLPRRNFVSPR
ncbi:MAG: hypothetical protein WCY19_08400, partial [Candidatus Gastranaerophilaceae bacterium]